MPSTQSIYTPTTRKEVSVWITTPQCLKKAHLPAFGNCSCRRLQCSHYSSWVMGAQWWWTQSWRRRIYVWYGQHTCFFGVDSHNIRVGKILLDPTNISTQIPLTSARKTLHTPLQSVTGFPFLLVLSLLHGRGCISDEGEWCNGHYNHMPDLGRLWCGEDFVT